MSDVLEEAPPEAKPEPTIDQLVDAYIQLRDKKAQLKARHDAEMAPITAMLDKVEVRVLQQLQAMGVESARTAAGTAYLQKRTSASVADWDSFLAFVREQGMWQMLEHRAAKGAVDEYAAQNGDLPPGLNYRQEVVVNFRRS